ncbi:MAG: GAF domain-containing protein [Anaerolineae bacterium]
MQQYWQAVLDNLGDEVIVIDRDLQVKWVNAAVRQNAGGRVSPIGQPCYVVSHHVRQPCQSPDCVCPVPAVLAAGEPVRVTHFHPNGSNGEGRYVEIVASPLRDETGQIQQVVEVLRDVTEQQNLREALLRRNRELSVLNAVVMAASQSLDLEQIMQTALDEVLRLTGLDVGAIFLMRRHTEELELLTQRCLSPEATEAMARLRLSAAPCGGAVETGQPVVVADVCKYRGSKWAALKGDGLRSLVHVPLLTRGAALGSLCLGTRTPRHFGREELALLSAIGSQIAIAVDNARLYKDLDRKKQMRRELLRQLITVQEDERRRIARGLHDDTCQALTALLYSLETAAEVDDFGEVGSMLMRMWELTQHTLEGVYKLIHDLRPTLLDHLGLFTTLREYADRRLQLMGIRVHMEQIGSVRRLPSPIETALLRIVQEAISNIAEHSGATNAWITFDFQEASVVLTVEDDGIGFDPDEVAQSTDLKRGLGLLGMQERVNLVDGEITISSMPAAGTTVVIRVPMSAGEGSHG